MLNANQILSADDRLIETVDVPEWKGEVGVRIMGGDERDSYESLILKRTDNKGRIVDSKQVRVMLLVNVLCDTDGTKLFSEQQMTELNKKNSSVLDRLFKKALKINGMDEGAEKEIEKN